MKKPAHQTLTQFWRTIRANIEFGETSLEEISNLEERYAVKFPQEFREYLRWACPKGVDQDDPEMTTWWEIDRIKSLKEEVREDSVVLRDPQIREDSSRYIVFVDYILWCWAWAICCEPGENYGRILQLSAKNEFVANSFGEFVQFYIQHWDKGFHLPAIK